MNKEMNLSEDELNFVKTEIEEIDVPSEIVDTGSFVISEDVKFVRVVWCDNANIIRAKAVRIDSLEDFNFYVGISEAQQGVPVMFDGVIPESGLNPVGEVQLIGDMSTFRVLPYSKTQGRVMGNMMKNEIPWNYCPRGFLNKMIDEASKIGINIKGAFENEFYFLKVVDDIFEPLDTSPFASTYSMDKNLFIINEIIEALEKQGMEVQQYYPEAGPGQHEITVKYADALATCDNQIAFRETVKAIAGKNGLIASFLPKIFEEKAGSGCHLHLSLWKGKENILGDSGNEYGISDIGCHFMAGILYHLPALMAITTPIPNSYRRIKPNFWSGAFKCWGVDNREAAVRGISETDGIMKHFEFKTLDASSNPYLAFGAIIAAGLQGIKEKMELEKPLQLNPGALTDRELNENGIIPLPSKLGEAISELEKDNIILSAMGNKLSRAYIAVKKAEMNAMEGLSLEEEVELLLDKY
ncbi:glutamine synthetase family protein [Methanobacterium sp. ACI-7]|uniref:glutamine synthetase family protein n=1 Tax=unclassified Methanobacterium TaxID=2627676 RepID=UPI0039C22949